MDHIVVQTRRNVRFCIWDEYDVDIRDVPAFWYLIEFFLRKFTHNNWKTFAVYIKYCILTKYSDIVCLINNKSEAVKVNSHKK